MLHCCFRGRDIVFVFTNKYCDENKNEAQRSSTFTTNVTILEGRPIKILNMLRNASRYAEAEA